MDELEKRILSVLGGRALRSAIEALHAKLISPQVAPAVPIASSNHGTVSYSSLSSPPTGKKQITGGSYTGQLLGGKANGRGVCIYANGNRYDGEWKENQRNGRGVYTYASGDRYDGQWKHGNKCGRGVLTFVVGDRYDGEFKDNKMNGRGVLSYADGRSPLVGIWENGDYKRK